MSHRCEGRAGQKWGAGAPNQKKCPGGGLEFRCGVAAPQLNSDEYGLSVSDRIYMEPINHILELIYRLRMELAQTIFEFHGTSLRGGEPPLIGWSRETTSVPSPVQFHEERIVS
jgi:hypothetical protein